MMIKRDADLPVFELPGLQHRTLCAEAGLEVWKQRLLPGAATPMHRHDCVEVVVVVAGSGVVEGPDGERGFSAPATLLLAPGEVHQIRNTGAQDMEVVATLAMGPVRVETPQGEPIALPW
jgi:mannose-6-phosphate isomerase-like protein (cupin superfamily)